MMGDGGNGTPAGEYSAGTGDLEGVTTYLPCRHCDTPVAQPTGGKRRKDFCSARHRAAYREAEHQKALVVTANRTPGRSKIDQCTVDVSRWTGKAGDSGGKV